MKVVAVWIGGITALVEGSTQPIAWAARVEGFASGSLMRGEIAAAQDHAASAMLRRRRLDKFITRQL